MKIINESILLQVAYDSETKTLSVCCRGAKPTKITRDTTHMRAAIFFSPWIIDVEESTEESGCFLSFHGCLCQLPDCGFQKNIKVGPAPRREVIMAKEKVIAKFNLPLLPSLTVEGIPSLKVQSDFKDKLIEFNSFWLKEFEVLSFAGAYPLFSQDETELHRESGKSSRNVKGFLYNRRSGFGHLGAIKTAIAIYSMEPRPSISHSEANSKGHPTNHYNAKEVLRNLGFLGRFFLGPFKSDDVLVPLDGFLPDEARLYGSEVAERYGPILNVEDLQRIKNAPEGYKMAGFWGSSNNELCYYYCDVQADRRIYFCFPFGDAHLENEEYGLSIKRFINRLCDMSIGRVCSGTIKGPNGEDVKYSFCRQETTPSDVYAVEAFGKSKYKITLPSRVIDSESLMFPYGDFKRYFTKEETKITPKERKRLLERLSKD